MRTIPIQLVTLVKTSEGFHRVVTLKPVPTAVPYLCPASYWTRGYGVLCSKDAGPITEPEAEAELLNLLPVYIGHACRLSPRLIIESDARLTGVTDFIFNLGPGRYAASTLRRKVNAGDWAGARVEMLKWVWGGGKRLPGLVIRRQIDASFLI